MAAALLWGGRSNTTLNVFSEELRKSVRQGEERAHDMLSKSFDWLDSREVQPTKDVLLLYEQSQAIEKKIRNALVQMQQANIKRNDLEKMTRDIDKADIVSPYKLDPQFSR